MTRPRPAARHPLLGAVLAAVLAAALTAACSDTQPPAERPSTGATTSTGPSTGTTPTPPVSMPEPPPRGACYRMTLTEALAPTNEQPSTPCRRPHTTETYHVGRLVTVVDGHLLAVDSDRAQRAVAAACPRRLPRFLGGTAEQLRLTVLRPVWFTPTLPESDAGADWYRCDVAALADSETLLESVGSLRGVLRRPAARARLGLCGTGQPGSSSFARVACGESHAWRAVATYDVAGAAYPGTGALEAQGASCKKTVGERAEDPLNYRWAFDYPTPAQWQAGQRYGVCWAPG